MHKTRHRAITTRYSGYAFRSRLEARWAIFFDALGIKWQYEMEGFELGNGLRYLPDFWLPDWNLWVEVKPSAIDDVTREKARRLVELTNQPVYCTEGMPDRNGVLFFDEDYVRETPAFAYFAAADWRLILAFNGESERCPMQFYGGSPTPGFDLHGVPYDAEAAARGVPDRPGRFRDALYAARGARFEFGANGGAA